MTVKCVNDSQLEGIRMITISKVGRRGQITIPRRVRRRLSLDKGDHVAFVERETEVVLQPLSLTLLDLKGSIRVSGPQDFSAIRKRVLEDHAQKVAHDEA